MAEKLYYSQPHAKEFDAQVVSCCPQGEYYAVVLDRTVFFPEGGGQPCDLGTLDGVSVLDVQEIDGEAVHTCTGPLTVGATVHGEIDWERRFDLMQQHSGEHLVSGIVHCRFGYHNVGFHMGAEVLTIDFSGILTMEQLFHVEQTANEMIWKNLATEVTYYDPENPIEYRSKKELQGEIRLVSFPGVDVCACCGTHVTHTGEIGMVKILSCVRFHDGVRIEMVCGKRAVNYLSEIFDQNRGISGLLSAKPKETAQEVRRLMEQNQQQKYALVGMENRLVRLMAASLADKGDVFCVTENLSAPMLRKLATDGAAACKGLFALFNATENGYQYGICKENADISQEIRAMNQALSGRGGGRNGFAQGSVGAGKTQIQDYFAQLGITEVTF